MTGLELGEDLGEKGRFAIDSQHFTTEQIDDEKGSVPELVTTLVLHQKWLQWIRDLVSHISVAQVKTGENHCLQLLLALHVFLNEFSQKHV